MKEVVLHPGFTLGAHLASAGLVALTFFNGSLFGYHPTLMAASFLLFMPEALLSAIRGGVVSESKKGGGEKGSRDWQNALCKCTM